uniref:phage holin, lambda family n=1 Tax=Halomonas sp. TaxID=1486246 RepID=UPI002603F25C|nr:phage holin, lambda family [Halomonas sp.]
MTKKRVDMLPDKDPSFWQALFGVLSHNWPQLYAAGMACIVAFARAMQAGGEPLKSLLEAVLCGCLTLSLVPVLQYFGLSLSLAVSLGGAVGFLGTKWIRERASIILETFLLRGRK